jgi:hypothetical protein
MERVPPGSLQSISPANLPQKYSMPSFTDNITLKIGWLKDALSCLEGILEERCPCFDGCDQEECHNMCAESLKAGWLYRLLNASDEPTIQKLEKVTYFMGKLVDAAEYEGTAAQKKLLGMLSIIYELATTLLSELKEQEATANANMVSE